MTTNILTTFNKTNATVPDTNIDVNKTIPPLTLEDNHVSNEETFDEGYIKYLKQ